MLLLDAESGPELAPQLLTLRVCLTIRLSLAKNEIDF